MLVPAGFTAMPDGRHSEVLVAATPLVTVLEQVPLPAMVLMTPVANTTSRTTLLPVSAMYRLPAPSTATPVGASSSALLAGPLSPL